MTILALAIACRAGAIGTQLYSIHSDETFQYLEQGYRLHAGSGVVPWEFIDGVRSWLLPGVIAALIRVSTWFSGDPVVYLTAIRLCAAAVSLTPVFIAFRYGQAIGGSAAAALSGAICAVWFEAIYFAPVVMTEVLAAHIALWAFYLNDPRHGTGRARLTVAGICYALAICVRFQYAPALLAAMVWLNRLDGRRWRYLFAGGVPVALLIGGLLDTASWGTPFQSIWLYAVRNVWDGVSTANGVRPRFQYLRDIWWVWQPAAPLLLFAVVGAMRLPALALAAIVTLLSHSLLSHKEYRFIYLTLIALPLLMGAGLAVFARWGAGFLPRAAPRWCLHGALATLVAAVSWFDATHGLMPGRWTAHRWLLRSSLAASRQPDLCGLGLLAVPIFNTGGYVYVNRDIPMFFSAFAREAFLGDTAIPIRTEIVFRGKPLPQYTEIEMAAFASRFNYLIAPPARGLPGYDPVACFGDSGGTEPACLYHRPGPCG